jgi:hypothetical protein
MNAPMGSGSGVDPANKRDQVASPPLLSPPTNATSPPVHPRPSAAILLTQLLSWFRRNLTKLGLIVACVVVVAVATSLVDSITRHDAPEDLALLCTALMDRTPIKGEAEVRGSDAEATIRIKRYKEQIPRIARRSRKLAPVARDLAKLIGKAEEIAQNGPSGSKFAFGFAELILGVYTGERGIVASGGSKALGQAESVWNAVSGALAVFNEKHVLAIELAQAVEELSGPPTNSPVISARFSEHTPILFQVTTTETLLLTNSSQIDLHNAVISVRFSNGDGESYLNVHFAPNWPSGETKALTYSDTAFPKTTVPNIQRVEVRVLSSEVTGAALVFKKPLLGWPDP